MISKYKLNNTFFILLKYGMNKFLFLIFFYFLCFSTIAKAGIDEAGSGNWCQLYNKGIKLVEENQKQKRIKNKKYSMIYAACETDGVAYQSYLGNNLEKLKKKTYKKCMEWAKEYNLKDCYIFSLNGEVLWQKKYDWDKGDKRAKLLADKVAKEKKLIKEKDTKLGRFIEDQPDVNDDFQFHVIYTLYADSKDNENDINGKIEKYIRAGNDWIYKKTKGANKKTNTMNSEGQRLKWDYRKDGKLDISFLRLPKTKKEMKKCGGRSCGNFYERTIINSGFNNPKKIYLNFGGFRYSDWPYSTGFPIFNIFQSHQGNPLTQKDFSYFLLHEAIHSMTGISPCSPNHVKGHNTKKSSDMMSRDRKSVV